MSQYFKLALCIQNPNCNQKYQLQIVLLKCQKETVFFIELQLIPIYFPHENEI